MKRPPDGGPLAAAATSTLTPDWTLPTSTSAPWISPRDASSTATGRSCSRDRTPGTSSMSPQRGRRKDHRHRRSWRRRRRVRLGSPGRHREHDRARPDPKEIPRSAPENLTERISGVVARARRTARLRTAGRGARRGRRSPARSTGSSASWARSRWGSGRRSRPPLSYLPKTRSASQVLRRSGRSWSPPRTRARWRLRRPRSPLR